MSDFIKKNPFTASVIFFLLVLVMFFFGLVKPSIERGDDRVYNKMEDRVVNDIEELIKTNKEILNEIRGE